MTEPHRLGTAIRSLPLLGGVRTGHHLVVVSRNTRPTRVIAYDLRDRTIAADVAIDDGDGAWGVAADGDWVYVGLLGARGRTNLFRVRISDGATEGLAAIDANHVWDLAVAGDGQLVGVTDQPLVFAWDPTSGRARAMGMLGDGESVRAVAVAGDAVVIGGNRHGRAWARAHPFDDRAGRELLPEALAGHQTVYTLAARGRRVAVGTRGPDSRDPAVALLDLDDAAGAGPLAVVDGEEVVDAADVGDAFTAATVRRSGAVVRLDHDGDLTRLPAPVPPMENRVVSVLGGALVGATGDGSVWSMRADGSAVDPVHLLASGRVAGSPERVQSLTAADGRVLVGGTFGVTEHDLAAGTSRWRSAPGEAKAIVVVGGEAYLALYPVGAVHRLAAGAEEVEAWVALPAEQNRPQDLAWVSDADVLAVTTASDRRGGGALHLIDRATGTASSHTDVLGRGQHPTGLAVVAGRFLVGGSGSDPTLLCWDAAADREVWRLDGIDDAGALVGMAVVDGRLVAVGTGGVAVAVDVDDGSVVARRALDAGGGRAVAASGTMLITDGDRVWKVEPDTLEAEVVVDGLAGAFWGRPDLAVDDDGALVIAGRDLARLELE